MVWCGVVGACVKASAVSFDPAQRRRNGWGASIYLLGTSFLLYFYMFWEHTSSFRSWATHHRLFELPKEESIGDQCCGTNATHYVNTYNKHSSFCVLYLEKVNKKFEYGFEQLCRRRPGMRLNNINGNFWQPWVCRLCRCRPVFRAVLASSLPRSGPPPFRPSASSTRLSEPKARRRVIPPQID